MAGEVPSGIQNYVDLAAGLTKATRAKARAAAKSLLATAGLEDVAADATDRVGKLAEEVLAASKANRELMGKLVATEVDKAAGRLGFIRAEELDEVRRELAELRMSLAHAAAHDSAEAAGPAASATGAPFAADLGLPDPPVAVDTLPEPEDVPPIEPITEPVAPPARPATKAPAKKAAAKKAATTKTSTSSSTAAKAPAENSPAESAPAKKAPAKKAPARKAPAKKAAAKSTAGNATKAPASDA